MGGTTHMAWLAEGPAGPRAAWTATGKRLKGIFPTSIIGVEKRAGLVTGYTRLRQHLSQPKSWQMLM